MDLGRVGGPLLEAPDLAPWRGYVEEDCSDAFDDAGFSEWYFDQA